MAALPPVHRRIAPLALIAGAASGVTALAGEPRRSIDVSRALDAGGPAGALPVVTPTRTPPDPQPLVERTQWVLDLRWDRGDVWLLGAQKTQLDTPRATPRAMGRFALELFEGKALLERVRFDFPLLGGLPDLGDGGWSAPPSLTPKLRTRIGVFFPATDRGTRLELVDRATDRRWSIGWPPPSMADAGPP